ncbi:MAG: response regulator [Polyangiaceae bacterium]|nr:response regulator [Polyangiaceae bacterium]
MTERPKTVLVTDDDDDILAIVSMMLEFEGYRITTAHDGLEALDRIQKEMPDLILLDMKMPRMSGWEFAAEYEARYGSRRDRAPIIVMTAAEHAAKRAAEIGATSCLPKPFSADQLAGKVRAFVGQGLGAPAPAMR